MPVRPVRVGQRVVSRAGRDRGQEYMIYRWLDERFVLVVDGLERTVTRPKKKNVRHLEPCQDIAAELARAAEAGLPVSDIEVRQALLAWKREREGGGTLSG